MPGSYLDVAMAKKLRNSLLKYSTFATICQWNYLVAKVDKYNCELHWLFGRETFLSVKVGVHQLDWPLVKVSNRSKVSPLLKTSLQVLLFVKSVVLNQTRTGLQPEWLEGTKYNKLNIWFSHSNWNFIFWAIFVFFWSITQKAVTLSHVFDSSKAHIGSR